MSTLNAREIDAWEADFTRKGAALVQHFDRFLAEAYGPRCDEFESGCAVCEMYARRDYLCDAIA